MLHIGDNFPGWTEPLPLLPDGSLVKLLDLPSAAQEVKAINGRLRVLVRHVGGGNTWSDSWAENVAMAEAEYRAFADAPGFDEYAPYIDYVEEPRNEYIDDDQTRAELARRVLWARACAYVWETVFRPRWPHIRTLIGNVPVGNHAPLGLFEAAHDFDAGLAVHAYVHFSEPGKRDPLDFTFHSGRWVGDDARARAAGYVVDIAVTETGPYADEWHGWRSALVLDGDVAGYVDAMEAALRDWATTHAWRTGRFLGFNIFTSGGSGWDLYQTYAETLKRLAEMVRRVTEDYPMASGTREWQKLVFLVPQATTREQYDAVATVAFESKTEIAFSADSAFARPANVTAHKVVVYDADGWGGRESLEAWVDEHYAYEPATEIEYRGWPASAGGF